MSDEEIGHLLNVYVRAEMAAFPFEHQKMSEHEYSPKYQRKLRRLLWSEKYFNRRIKVGLALRRAAVVLLVVIGLLAATEVTARVFGFNPWKYFTIFDDKDKMGGIEFETMADSEPEEEMKVAVRDVPSYVPEGLVEKERGDSWRVLNVEWGIMDYKDSLLSYSRSILNEEFTFWYDGEYESKESIEICGYLGNYYKKGNSHWILWSDSKYCYMIKNYENSSTKEEIIKMAESIYK